MSLFKRLQQIFSGVPGPVYDREADLSMTDPSRLYAGEPSPEDAVQALADLFRSRGDVESAVRLRRRLLADRPGGPLAAALHFELGCDYRAAGLFDRAVGHFKEAERLGFSSPRIRTEIARIHADSGNFSAAADDCAALGNAPAQAHFLVRMAEEASADGKEGAAKRLLHQALAVYEASPEAHLALVGISLTAGDDKGAAEQLGKALARLDDTGKLLLLEGLYALSRSSFGPDLPSTFFRTLARALSMLPENRDAGLMECYYCGLFFLLCKQLDTARLWFTKALVLSPDFWAARLALLEISLLDDELSPEAASHVEFFVREGARAKRFLCSRCGLRREHIFFFCPRCRTWHSAVFRHNLQ